MSSNYCFNVTVYRDSLSTPWGFRLEGGKDYQSPLTIQRVFQGSPASGYLQRGDIIINIQNKDASQLFHQEANELIKRSGGSLQLTIKRGQPYPGSDGAAYHPSSPIYIPQTSGTTRTVTSYINFKPVSRTVTSYVDYDNRYHEPEPTGLVRNRVIEKIHDPKPILSQTGSPILPYTGSSSAKSGFQLRRYQSSRTLPLPTTFNKVPISAPVPAPSQPTTPYQDKEMIDKIQSSLSRITTRPRLGSLSVYPSTPNIYTNIVYNPIEPDEYGSLHVSDKVAQFQHQSRQNQPAINQQRRQVGYHSVAYNPPWKGPLQRNAGFSSVSPIRPQQQPKPQPPPAPKGPIDFGTVGSLKIVNNQYNTPIGLYSNRNINEELSKQVGGNIRHHSQSGYELPASDF